MYICGYPKQGRPEFQETLANNFKSRAFVLFNPRTYKQIYTPSVVEVDGTLPRVFDMLQYLETSLPLVESI